MPTPRLVRMCGRGSGGARASGAPTPESCCPALVLFGCAGVLSGRLLALVLLEGLVDSGPASAKGASDLGLGAEFPYAFAQGFGSSCGGVRGEEVQLLQQLVLVADPVPPWLRFHPCDHIQLGGWMQGLHAACAVSNSACAARNSSHRVGGHSVEHQAHRGVVCPGRRSTTAPHRTPSTLVGQ